MKKYELVWRNKWLTADAKTMEDMVAMLHGAADHLQEIIDTGEVMLGPGGMSDDYAFLMTTDKATADRFGFVEIEEDEEGFDEEDELEDDCND